MNLQREGEFVNILYSNRSLWFAILKEKTPTWLYRDFILAYFGKKVSNMKYRVDVNTRFLLAQEGDSFDWKTGKTEDLFPMKTDLSFLYVSALTFLGIATIVGFYMGRVSQSISLPSVVGYMIREVILGPSILNLID